MSADVVVLGGGGHARVLLEILRLRGATVLGLTDCVRPQRLPAGVAYLGDDAAILALDPATVLLVNGIGSTASTEKRRWLYEDFARKGYRFADVTHPAAVLSTHETSVGEGVQIMAGAVVNPCSRLGDNVLINTRAVVEHDCIIGEHAHVASGAVVCGGCEIGAGAHIGAGATIIQGKCIGTGAIVAAGAAVIRDVRPYSLVAGVPAIEKRVLYDD